MLVFFCLLKEKGSTLMMRRYKQDNIHEYISLNVSSIVGFFSFLLHKNSSHLLSFYKWENLLHCLWFIRNETKRKVGPSQISFKIITESTLWTVLKHDARVLEFSQLHKHRYNFSLILTIFSFTYQLWSHLPWNSSYLTLSFQRHNPAPVTVPFFFI